MPISKAFACDLPLDRPFTELESMYSVQLDFDQNNTVTVAGYASSWRWSRKRVTTFLSRINAEIVYPENSKKKRNQRGHIVIHKRDIKGTYKEHKRLCENNNMQTEKNIKGTYKEHKRDIKGSTTKEPNTNTKKIYTSKRFDEWWNIYPKKVGKKESREKWKSKNLDRMADKLIEDIQKRLCSEKWKNGFVPNPMTYLNGDRWEDELEPEEVKPGITQHTSPEHLESERKRLRGLGN